MDKCATCGGAVLADESGCPNCHTEHSPHRYVPGSEGPCQICGDVHPDSYADKMARRERSLQRKAEQRREWAEKARQRSEKHAATAQRIGDAIPVGQPILNGHHSANRHRRDNGRIERAYVASFTESEKSESHTHKADNAEAALRLRDTPGFCHRRIKEAEALIRKLEREKEWRCSHSAEEAARWQTLLDEAKDKALYWTRRLDAVTREDQA